MPLEIPGETSWWRYLEQAPLKIGILLAADVRKTLETYLHISVYIANKKQKTRAIIPDVRVDRQTSLGVPWDEIRVMYRSSLLGERRQRAYGRWQPSWQTEVETRKHTVEQQLRSELCV